MPFYKAIVVLLLSLTGPLTAFCATNDSAIASFPVLKRLTVKSLKMDSDQVEFYYLPKITTVLKGYYAY